MSSVMSPADFMDTAQPMPKPAGGKSETPPLPGGVIKPSDFMKGMTKPASSDKQPGFFVKGAKKGFADAKDFWTEVSNGAFEQQKEGVAAMKEGWKNVGEGRQPFIAMGGFGESLLGAMQYGFSWGSSIWDEGKKYLLDRPAETTAGYLSKLAPDKSDKPWVITKSDIHNTASGLADFTNQILQVVMPLGGAEKNLSKEALELVPKSMKDELKNRPVTQAQKVETAFDELMHTDPEGAKHVEESVTKFSPEMQKLFDAKWKKFEQASEKDLNAIGKKAAENAIKELEGKFPDVSKLDRVKPVGKEADAQGKILQKQEEDQVRLQRSQAVADEISKALEKGAATSEKPSMSQVLRGVGNLHEKVRPMMDEIVERDKPTGAHEIMNHLLDNAEGPVKDILERLRKYLPNLKVSFVDSLPFKGENGVEFEAGGIYNTRSNDIRINRQMYRDGLDTTQVFLHEATHAVTARLLDAIQAGPKKDLENLLTVARERARTMMEKGIQRKDMYALTNIHELIAETMSNPEFQRWLMASEYYEKDPNILHQAGGAIKNLFDAIVAHISRMIGMDPKEHLLFHNIMTTTHEVMEAQLKHKEALDKLFTKGDSLASKAPEEFDFTREPKTREIMKGKIESYWDQIIRNLAPEAASKEARLGGAYIAKAIAGLARDDSQFVHRSMERKLWWAKNKARAMDFVDKFERGVKQATPQLEDIAKAYNNWAARIVAQDARSGVKEYEAIDHYLPRVFENPEAVEAWLEGKFGSSWRAPGFTKERSYEYLSEAMKAGFKPKFKNLEDMFLARQHASDIAEMKLEIMRDLTSNGLAVEKTGQKPPGPTWYSRPSPDGKSYWIHPDVAQILHNAFDSKSLWSMEGIGGDTFRAAMGLKNSLIPLKLFGSLFHPLHIASLHNAAAMTRATATMLSGTESPVKWLGRMTQNAIPLYHSIADAPEGYRLLQAFKGQVKNLTHADMENLKLMQEGSFIPEMSSQYRTRAMDRFKQAIAEHSVSAAWKLPGALLQMLQRPIFEVWIPSLKSSSYLKDAQEWMKRNPQASEQERIVSLRKISKSVDNRYGEMAYNTLFWKRYVKDIAVADTLSLGWNLGFVREYGGGLLDAGQAVRGGSLTKAAASGMLDRPLFVALYTTQALAYGGLMTWAMTGKSPEGWMDYIYPRTGKDNPDGTPARVNTMFYTREFGALYKHSQAEGPVRGVAETIYNKGSGLMSLATEAIRGVNEWGAQIRSENDPVYKQAADTLKYALKDLEPIAASSVKGPIGANQETGLAFAGFTPAGKYITQTKTQGKIDWMYNKTYAPRETPFDKAQYSEDARALRQAWQTDQMDKYDQKLEEMQEKYKLTGTELRKLTRGISKDQDPTISKFSQFSEGDQKALLDQMSEEERDTYLRHAKKKLRREYEAP